MRQKTLQQIVIDTIAGELELAAGTTISPDGDLFTTYNADLLDAVGFAMELEDVFGLYRLHIDDETVNGFKTAGQYINHIARLTNVSAETVLTVNDQGIIVDSSTSDKKNTTLNAARTRQIRTLTL